MPKNTDYIRYERSSNQLWRPTPEDPFIYISFSTQLLLATHPPFQPAQIYGYAEMDPEIKEELKKIIKKEWIDRAHVPVRFLADDETNVVALRNTNICFITCMGLTPFEYIIQTGKVGLEAQPLNAPDFERKHRHVVATQIQIPNMIGLGKGLNNLNEMWKYIILHETAHALVEFKHFKIAGRPELEQPPFNENLTCEDTVMAYQENCPKVRDKIKRIFGDKTPDINKSAASQRNWEKIAASYNATLGPLDIEAAAEFNLSWQARLQQRREQLAQKTAQGQASQTKTEAESNNNSPTHIHSELYSFSVISSSDTAESNVVPMLTGTGTNTSMSTGTTAEAETPTALSSLPTPETPVASLINFGIFVAATCGLYKYASSNSQLNLTDDQLAKELSARQTLQKVHRVSLEDVLEQLCGKNNINDPEKIENILLIKNALIKVVNHEVDSEIGNKFNEVCNIQNRHLRYKELIKIAKMIEKSDIRSRFMPN